MAQIRTVVLAETHRWFWMKERCKKSATESKKSLHAQGSSVSQIANPSLSIAYPLSFVDPGSMYTSIERIYAHLEGVGGVVGVVEGDEDECFVVAHTKEKFAAVTQMRLCSTAHLRFPHKPSIHPTMY